MNHSLIAYKTCPTCAAQFRNAEGADSCPYDATPLSQMADDPLIGAVIQDKFKVLSIAGIGGWSVVYKAQHLGLNKTVALKFLHKHFVDDRDKQLRFHNEATAVATLSHPNIVFVHDFGMLENGQPYIAMDWLEGRTLSSLLAQKQRLQPGQIIDLFSQACCALTVAHEAGVIHRDIKPSNMIIVDQVDGTPRLILCDFGLAKLTSLEQSLSLTRTGQTLGTPAYMSPEQCLGKELDPRSDLYSLGCAMYQALTGVLPFEAASYAAFLQKHVHDKPVPPSARLKDCYVPAKLESIVMRALAKDPEQRYQSAFQMVEDLWDAKLDTKGTKPVKQLFHAARANVQRHKWMAVSIAALTVIGSIALFASLPVHRKQPNIAQTHQPEYARYVEQADLLLEQEFNRSRRILEAQQAIAKEQGPGHTVKMSAAEQGERLKLFHQIADLLEKALALADADHLPNVQKLPILEKLRVAYINQPDYTKLNAEVKKELAIYEQMGSKTRIFGALNMLTWCNYNLRQVAPAQDYARQTLRAAAQAYGRNSTQYGAALQDLGSTQLIAGNYVEAEKNLRLALPFEANSPATRMITMAQIAITQAAQGRYEQARTYLETVVDESRQAPMAMKLTTGKELRHLAQQRIAEGKVQDAAKLEGLAKITEKVHVIGLQ